MDRFHVCLLIAAICLRWRVNSFAPPRHRRMMITTMTRQKSSTIRQRLAPISDLQDIIHHVKHAADHHPAIESLFSTLISSTASIEPPSHGHSNPLFGLEDPLLKKGAHLYPSIPIDAPQVKVDHLPDEWIKLTEKYPDKILDTRKMLEVNVDAMPGFPKEGHLLPPHYQPDQFAMEYDAARNDEQYFLQQVMGGNIRMLNMMFRLPSVVSAVVVVDFLFLGRLVNGVQDIYPEDLEDEEGRNKITIQFLKAVAIRFVACAILGWGLWKATEFKF